MSRPFPLAPATSVFLHGFGARYDLPITLSLYLYGAGAVVVLSFVLVAVFAGSRLGERAIRYPRLPAPWLAAAARSPLPRAAGGALGVLALVAIVVSGLLGSQDPSRNPAEYLTWIYFWAGLVILSGLLGNLWSLLNPWTAIHDLLSQAFPTGAPLELPRWLGMWPAVFVYFCFAWLELASGLANHPVVLASLALAYTLLNLAGMRLVGRRAWLERCEAFTVLFGIVGRFGPVEIERDPEGQVTRAWLRPWGTGLLQPVEPGWDRVCFVILMLSTLAFDGIIATPAWQGFAAAMAPWSAPLGQLGSVLVRTLGMVLLAVTFLLVFTAFMRLVIYFGAGSEDPLTTITSFAYTLVPIALVYNAAHNYSYLMVQSQGLFPLLDDPLARGWNLVPQLVGYAPSFALAGAATVWYMQVVLIVLGHVIAVYLAHLRAGERFRTATRALISQYPMLLLMVMYTMTSLWILAQPTTREG